MSGLLSIGVRAMNASQTALQVAGHNIANANTAGYSRQDILLSATPGSFSGAGYIGKGVQVAGVARAYDAYAVREEQRSSSQAAMDEARLQQLEQLDTLFPLGEQGLGHAATQLFNAYVDVASAPQDLSARQVVVSRAEDFAARARAVAEQLEQMQSGVRNDLGVMSTQANQIIDAIARVNGLIQAAQGASQAPNDLLDQRDQLVRDLSALVPVSTVETDQGGLNVMLPGGQALVMGSQARALELRVDPADARLRQVALVGSAAPLSGSQLAGGSLGGVLRFQNEDLPATRSRFEALVTGVTTAVNAQQALGVAVDAADGLHPGAPIFDDGGQGALGLQVAMRDPLGVAAAAPVAASAAAANLGTASVAALTVRSWDGASTPQVELEFTGAAAGSAATGYRWRVDGGAWTNEASLPQPLTLDFPVGGDPDSAALGWSLNLQGAPKAGDRFSVAPPAGSSAEVAEALRHQNGNALAMVGLREKALVGGSTAGDAYAELIAEVGLRVEGGRTLADLSASAAEQATAERSARSGVNLDEEAARLIQYQQAYQASAKVLQIAQSLFDTLLQTAG